VGRARGPDPRPPAGGARSRARGDRGLSTRGDPYLVALAALFGLEWVALAINPRHRQDWALENALSAVLVATLVLLRRRLPLSRVSYTALFVFLALHTVGAHYTYSEVPYDEWSRALTGRSLSTLLGWERNHYDRVVHFLYGFLLVYPIRQILTGLTGVRGAWGYYLPFAITSSSSADYELIEWGAAMVFGGDLGVAYLGTQGDVWDAQKDMALAASGALLCMILLAIINSWSGSGEPPPR
jgi:putative membrane protein